MWMSETFVCVTPPPPPHHTHTHTPAQEGEPLQHEGACLLQAARVRAPVLQAVVGEVPEVVQPLRRGDVPVPPLLDLREDPGLYQRPPVARGGSARRKDQPDLKTVNFLLYRFVFFLIFV